MQTESYLNNLSVPTSMLGAAVNTKVLADGRRVKENITEVSNDDGSREVTHELLEEVIPMRVAERVRRRFTELPVEESHERIAEDGSIQTDVRKLENLELGSPKPADKIDALTEEVRALRAAISPIENESVNESVEEIDDPKPTFFERASVLWARKSASGAKSAPIATGKTTKKIAPDVLYARRSASGCKSSPAATSKTKSLTGDIEVVAQHESSKVEFWLSMAAWVACAVVAGLVTYSLL